jgi:hypothetical protein
MRLSPRRRACSSFGTGSQIGAIKGTNNRSKRSKFTDHHSKGTELRTKGTGNCKEGTNNRKMRTKDRIRAESESYSGRHCPAGNDIRRHARTRAQVRISGALVAAVAGSRPLHSGHRRHAPVLTITVRDLRPVLTSTFKRRTSLLWSSEAQAGGTQQPNNATAPIRQCDGATVTMQQYNNATVTMQQYNNPTVQERDRSAMQRSVRCNILRGTTTDFRYCGFARCHY